MNEEISAVSERSSVPINDTWDLSHIYNNLNLWEEEYKKTKENIPNLTKYQGLLGSSTSTLKEALKCYYSLSESIERLYTYSHLISDQDTRDPSGSNLLQRSQSLVIEFGAASSYIAPELLQASNEFLTEALNNNELKDFHRYIEELKREKPHILSSSEEEILSLAGDVLGSSRKIFGQLNDADLKFKNVFVDDAEKPLTHGSYITFLLHNDRDVRKTAFTNYYTSFEEHQYTLAATMNANLKKDTFLARTRKFSSSRERSLFGDNIPETLYDSLVSEVSDNLGSTLHEYYSLRKSVLSLSEQCIFDTYVPLVTNPPKGFNFKEAVEILIEALNPLGTEYISTLKNGLVEDRWVDKYENIGKRSGAYSSGCYGSPPYILMNYRESSIESLFTLAHEAGHSMHTFFSNNKQPYPTHGYTIFVAEVASTCNEILLSNYLIDNYKNDSGMQLYLKNYKLDSIKATFFRQTMFAEFEKIIHASSDAQEPLTAKSFREIYRALLNKYFGPSVTLLPLDDLEGFRIPHFYSSFYVFKYATGLAAAFDLAGKLYYRDSAALKCYLDFLASGGSVYPLDALKNAGTDLLNPKTINNTIQIFKDTLNDVYSLLIKVV
ncbi:MAG TPA: oligoendopeptidase F [Oligoflexia bacterium]|nr:oligoendopeptidase F [Oligoflexia bacterium]HMP48447.1 oligoendopeptidase F [Oligoflexia bacterium]